MFRIGILAPSAFQAQFSLASLRLELTRVFEPATLDSLTAQDVDHANKLSDYQMIVLPGTAGENTPYPAFFSMENRFDKIRQYVVNGGVLWGICSGAWEMTDRFSYRFLSGEKKNFKGTIPLLDISASGPVDGAMVFSDDPTCLNDVRLLTLHFNDAEKQIKIPICYGNGPGFRICDVPAENYTVLAKFNPKMAAIIAHRLGSGIVIAQSPLLEIRDEHIPPGKHHRHDFMKTMLAANRRHHDRLWMILRDVAVTRCLPS